MPRFAKIEHRLWLDQKFRDLGYPSPNGMFLFLYLLSCPERTLIPGVIFNRLSTVFAHFGWSARDGMRCAEQLIRAGMLVVPPDQTSILWLPNALRYNPPANANIVKGWRTVLLEQLPESDMRTAINIAIRVYLKEFPAEYRAAFEEGNSLPNSLGNRLGNRSGNRLPNRLPDRSKNRLAKGLVNPSGEILDIDHRYDLVRTPALTRRHSQTQPYHAIYRLAVRQSAALAAAAESDRMEVLKTLCAQAHLPYTGELCRKVLDARAVVVRKSKSTRSSHEPSR
jgi:hypothetical protein